MKFSFITGEKSLLWRKGPFFKNVLVLFNVENCSAATVVEGSLLHFSVRMETKKKQQNFVSLFSNDELAASLSDLGETTESCEA